ncbi:MAG: DUF1614 domain-containing protein [Methermicoccaceae archaeon]
MPREVGRMLIYRPLSLLFLAVLMLLLVPLFLLVFVNVIGASFVKLGLSPFEAFGVLLASLLGSFVNIPILKRDVVVREVPQSPVFRLFGIFEYPRLVVKKQVVCINLGGAVIPLLVAVYLLSRVALYPVALAFVLVCVVCYVLATPVQGVGIVLPAFVPPIVSALAAIVLYPQSPAGVAFCAGVLGTIVGADILHLPSLLKGGADVLSIGGAGVFDGIFLTGVLAVLLS